MQISINRKYYSKKDLIEIIKFYSTDVGKKMNKNILPIFLQVILLVKPWENAIWK